MALSVVLFVPDGIVMASDGLAEVRNHANDHEFLQKKQRTIFESSLGYMVCTPCPTFVNGMPLSYYYERAILGISNCKSALDFTTLLSKTLKDAGVPVDNILFYVSGYTMDQRQEVYIADRNNINKVNEGTNNESVYNFHSVGHSIWLDKLLLPTFYKFESGETVCFSPIDIDFSKYSLEEAEDFACFLINTSREIDKYAQMNQNIGEFVFIGTHELSGKIHIRTHTQNQ